MIEEILASFCNLDSRRDCLEKPSCSVVVLSRKVYCNSFWMEGSSLLVVLSLSLWMQLSCDEQKLCFVLLPPGIPSHSLPSFSFLIPSFYKICALSAISCIALEAIGDLIHKKHTTFPVLLINGEICITNGRSWWSPTCSPLQPNSVETLPNWIIHLANLQEHVLFRVYLRNSLL